MDLKLNPARTHHSSSGQNATFHLAVLPPGVIHEDHLRELLTTMGDRFTDEEVDELFREAPIDKKGNFNYAEFTRILKHGAKDKDDE